MVCIGMAYVDIACVVIAYTVMTYIVMAHGEPQVLRNNAMTI